MVVSLALHRRIVASQDLREQIVEDCRICSILSVSRGCSGGRNSTKRARPVYRR